MMRAPSMPSTALRTSFATASDGAPIVTSRTTRVRPIVCMSTAPIAPPASPIAFASEPNAPGSLGMSIRKTIVKEIAGCAIMFTF